MTVTCKDDQYYTVREVAEIKGIRRQSVIDGCKRGQYPGAYKTVPDGSNRQGVWLIPKAAVNGVAIHEIVTVTRNITPADLQKMIEESVDEKMKSFEKRLENHDQLLTETIRLIQEKSKIEKKKPFWKFWI